MKARFNISAAQGARILHRRGPSRSEEGAGKAGRRSHPWVPCNKKHGGRTTGSTGNIRLSLRDGFTDYFALSPVTGFYCHRHAWETSQKLGASIGAPGP